MQQYLETSNEITSELADNKDRINLNALKKQLILGIDIMNGHPYDTYIKPIPHKQNQ